MPMDPRKVQFGTFGKDRCFGDRAANTMRQQNLEVKK